jgi:hypothetical protein
LALQSRILTFSVKTSDSPFVKRPSAPSIEGVIVKKRVSPFTALGVSIPNPLRFSEFNKIELTGEMICK